jgi:3-phosphoshikimate 1-carboxyvinyltransferase
MKFQCLPGGSIVGEARVAGDKSISHRSIMLASIAEGSSLITGFLEGEDALATVSAFRAMGVEIDGPNDGEVRVHGVGLRGLKSPSNPLDMGNSGTSMRLISGIVAGAGLEATLTGDSSLCGRPMGRVIDPLTMMGAQITSEAGGKPPLHIAGGQSLKGLDYVLPMASAQVKSCVLLAGLWADGTTSTTEPAPTRDHTERMLEGFGYPLTRSGNRVTIEGGGRLSAAHIEVPADISSATFFMVGASIAPGSDVHLTHVGVNPTRIGAINVLRMMGADIRMSNERVVGGEPVADIRVKYAPLQGITIPLDQVPLAIDEFPALFVAAACAEGTTILRGAEELRVKESDRIASMAEGLTTLGITNTILEDGIIIEGGRIGGGVIRTHHDHRIAMSFAIAALRAEAPIHILDCDPVATSFPNFDAIARGLGLQITTSDNET